MMHIDITDLRIIGLFIVLVSWILSIFVAHFNPPLLSKWFKIRHNVRWITTIIMIIGIIVYLIGWWEHT